MDAVPLVSSVSATPVSGSARPRNPASGPLARPPAGPQRRPCRGQRLCRARRRAARRRLAAPGLSELLLPHPGVGEIRLLAPPLVAAQRAGRLVMVFDPPAACRPGRWPTSASTSSSCSSSTRGPGWSPGSDSLWALEQALKSGHVGAVLAWLPPRLRAERLRRLQLAAHNHDGAAFVLRELAAEARPTASPLRLSLHADGADRLRVRVLKRRGPAARGADQLALPPALRAARRRRPTLESGCAACAKPPSSISPEVRRLRRVPAPCSGSRCTFRCSRSNRSPRPLAASGGEASGRPIALLEAHRIVSANAAARALGVKPGLKRATALALAPQIVLGQADAGATPRRCCRSRTPRSPSRRASRCSRRASPAAIDTVLLEVQASLRYFGGLERLLKRLRADAGARSATVRAASAPTAAAAPLASPEHRRRPQCADLPHTRTRSKRRRCGCSAPAASTGRPCRAWVCNLGDLLGLPRAGLARRFSEALLGRDRLRVRPPPRSARAPRPAAGLRKPARAVRPRRHHRAGLLRRLDAARAG